MPKETKVNPSSFDRAKISPYSKISNHNKNRNSSTLNIGDEADWEQIQCPICMEHPHDAVLLHCSSRDKGCRPFICDAHFSRSSCLDQFRNSSSSRRGSKISCPLCRGAVTAFHVVNPARTFMNSKTRGCAVETCCFAGNYGELRWHAESEHPPEARAAGPTRPSNWAELERQWDSDSDLDWSSSPDLDSSSSDSDSDSSSSDMDSDSDSDSDSSMSDSDESMSDSDSDDEEEDSSELGSSRRYIPG